MRIARCISLNNLAFHMTKSDKEITAKVFDAVF